MLFNWTRNCLSEVVGGTPPRIWENLDNSEINDEITINSTVFRREMYYKNK